MAPLPRPFTSTTSCAPARSASSTMSWMVGTSTMGSIAFGTAWGQEGNASPARPGGYPPCAVGVSWERSPLRGRARYHSFARADRLRDRVGEMSVRALQPRGGGHSAQARLPGHLRRRLALSLSFALAGGQAARAEGNHAH